MDRKLSDIRFSTTVNLFVFLGMLFNSLTSREFPNFFIVLAVFSGVGVLLNLIDYILASLKELKNA